MSRLGWASLNLRLNEKSHTLRSKCLVRAAPHSWCPHSPHFCVFMPVCLIDYWRLVHTPAKSQHQWMISKGYLDKQMDVRDSKLLLVRDGEVGSWGVQGIPIWFGLKGITACPAAGLPTPVSPFSQVQGEFCPRASGLLYLSLLASPDGFLMSHEPSLKTVLVQPNPGKPGSGQQEVREHMQK